MQKLLGSIHGWMDELIPRRITDHPNETDLGMRDPYSQPVWSKKSFMLSRLHFAIHNIIPGLEVSSGWAWTCGEIFASRESP